MGKKPAGRAAPPAVAAQAKPPAADPKVLTALAKQALEAGDLDKAQDLATQAQASAGAVKWGLFDDTPASVLKDVQKARGRRDRDVAERLMVEARHLIDKPTASRTERAANLTAAEEKARQAAGLNPAFSMWDFGDRPNDLLNDARKAREKEKLVAVRGEAGDEPMAMPKKVPGNWSKKAVATNDPPAAKPADPTRKKAAVALMQEAKALEIGRHYVEAKKKYTEAAHLNATFGKDEDTPETELARLNVAAQRRINMLADEARSCLDRKDATAARDHLDEAHMLALGMGLDASVVVELRASLKPAGRGKTADGVAGGPVIHNGRKADQPEHADKADGDSPTPIIRTGGKSKADDEPEVKPEVKVAGGDDDAPPITPIPTIRSGSAPVMKPIPLAPARSEKVEADLPPLPPVPDTATQANTVQPPKVTGPEPVKQPAVVGPAPIIRTRDTSEGLPVIRNRDASEGLPVIRSGSPAKPDATQKGEELLRAARAELKKGETEAARKIAIDLINGPYDAVCKDEAKGILQSADTKDAGRKLDEAKRAFDRGQEAFLARNYAQALAVFRQIDGMMLTAQDRKVMADMTAAAEGEEKKRQVTTDKLPAAPKPPVGVPDLPPTRPAAAPRTGADNLVQQQEALGQVEFQRLRTKALRVESEATARFGRGETDEALMDLQNFVTEVKASRLEPAKQNLLCRPVEARMDRLHILKHQTDFLTKEAKERRNFKAEMTQEALYKQKKQEEVAKLMKDAQRLSEDHKYKEAYAKVQMAQSMDPDDASIGHMATITERLLRMEMIRKADKSQELSNFRMKNAVHEYPDVDDRDPLRWTDDKEYRNQILKRGSGNIGVMRSKTESEKSIERKMSTPISVNFKGIALDAVVDQLHVMTSINFDLDLRKLKDENIDPKQPISTDLKDVSLKSALDIICRQAGLRHAIESEAIRISTAKGLSGRQTVKSLSVGDLVVSAPNFGAHPGMSLAEELNDARNAGYGRMSSSGSTPRTPPGSLPNGTTSGTGSTGGLPGIPGRLRNNTPMESGVQTNGNAEGTTLERELIRLITTTIKPDSWAALGGEGTIEYFPLGMALVINQSPEVIEEVERLLESLRKLQDLEVSIEVKVVSLAETFYERIGVDFSMGIPTNAKPVGGPPTGITVPGISSRNFQGNVVGLQVPGVATPDLDIPIRATSFNRAVPPFGGFSNSFQEGGIALGLAFLSDIQVSDVPGGRPGRHADERDAGPEADRPERDGGLDDGGRLPVLPDRDHGGLGQRAAGVHAPERAVRGRHHPADPAERVDPERAAELHPDGPADAGPRAVHPAGGVGRPAVRAAEHPAVVHEPDQRDASRSRSRRSSPRCSRTAGRASRSRSPSSSSSRGSPTWRPRRWWWCRTAGRW